MEAVLFPKRKEFFEVRRPDIIRQQFRNQLGDAESICLMPGILQDHVSRALPDVISD